MGFITLSILKSLAWFYAFSPAFLRKFYGRALGAFLRLLGLRKNVVHENLKLAFPESEPDFKKSRERIFLEAYEHLGNLVWEIILLLGPARRFIGRNTELTGIEHWKKATSQGKGVIFLAGHVGNWEIMAASGAANGIEIMIVTKHLKPEWLHQAIEKGRRSCGVGATYEPKTLKDVLRHLKNNKSVGFVLDQYAGPPVGVRVPFFGVPVGTNNVVAALARRTQAPILPVISYRLSDGKYRTEIRPPLEWKTDDDPQKELAINTAHYAKILEKHVREQPGQWLWIHRRFKGNLSPLNPHEWETGRARH